MSAAPAADLLGAAMVDFAAGRRAQAWLRVAPGRRLAHDLAAYFAPVTAHERALLDLVEGPVLDVGCGPARHARLLQARGLTVIGLDRSSLALELARSLGLRHWLHADARSGPLPLSAPPCCLTATSGWPGHRMVPCGSCTAWPRPADLAANSWWAAAPPAMGGCGPWSSGTSTGTWSDPGGGGCRPASRPSSTWPSRPAGASSTRHGGYPLLGRPFPRRPLVAPPARLGPVSLRVRPVLAVLLLAAAICGCSSAGPLGEYQAARTLHLAPDGRLIVTDLGSGKHDGTVTAVDVASGRQTVLMQALPSTRNSGQAHADLAGPSGAAMAADGTVAQPSATRPRQTPDSPPCAAPTVWWSTWRRSRPGASCRAIPTTSSPTAATAGMSATERPTTSCTSTRQARSSSSPASPASPRAGSADRDGQGVPTGMTLGPDRTLYVALYGGAPFDGPPAAVISLAGGRRHPARAGSHPSWSRSCPTRSRWPWPRAAWRWWTTAAPPASAARASCA